MHQEARESYAYDLQHWQPDVDDALIDWSDDVPHYKDRLGSAAFQATLLTGWPLISPAAWRAASILRPHLSVELRCYFSRPLTAITAPDTWIPCLLSMWPHPPCPLSTVVVQSTTKSPFIGSFLSLKNTMNVSIYSTTLTTLILYIRPEATDEPNHHPITTEVNAIDECGEVNAFLRDAPALLPSLNFIGIGGSYSFLCLTTLLSLCRHLGRRSSSHTDVSSQHFKLLIDESCCRFDDPISNDAPATVIAWHSAILATGNNMTRRKAATQQCISAALAQLKWCFLNTAQFQSEMMHYLDRHSSSATT
ncbi:unnamed protein product [Dicrocoelium dendriticum]|nr:unnamed protein product [Dicrocoelium dendriticum]